MEINPKLLDNIRQVTPYTPGEQPQNKVMKLNTNENPYPPAPSVQRVFEQLDANRLRLYPDPTSHDLIEALAKSYQVTKEQVFVGVGSDDILALCFLTFFNSKKPILFPNITYSFYKVWAELYHIPYCCPLLQEDFTLNPADYMRENGGIIFPNPNAPTGVYESLDRVEEIVKANPDVVVIVDEAYIDFAISKGMGLNEQVSNSYSHIEVKEGGFDSLKKMGAIKQVSAISLVDKYDNLMVVQTFSKSRSMAGIRIGYGVANPILIGFLNDVKSSFNSYTMNLPSLLCGVAALQEEEYFYGQIEKVITTREWTKTELKKLGFEFPNSRGNFIFARHPDFPGIELFQKLREGQIFVRHWNKEEIKDYLRITIGTQEEMEIFVTTLHEIMKAMELKQR